MQAIKPGHVYELENFENENTRQILCFIQKAPIQPDSEELETIQDGTTNEEVLRMLIDRMQFLHAKLPSRQSAIVITKLEEALMWLEHRTMERRVRGVEGTHKA